MVKMLADVSLWQGVQFLVLITFLSFSCVNEKKFVWTKSCRPQDTAPKIKDERRKIPPNSYEEETSIKGCTVETWFT